MVDFPVAEAEVEAAVAEEQARGEDNVGVGARGVFR